MTPPPGLTIWHHPQQQVPEGRCKICEETLPFHYDDCSVFDRFKDDSLGWWGKTVWE